MTKTRLYKMITLAMVSLFMGGFASSVKADEGMWIPMLVKNANYQAMVEKGLKLTPEQLYDINSASLKDAIVQFGNGCTGEVVSDQGLLFTNHHCGYGQIQAHSSVENDYLRDGFWAMTMEEELPNPGLTVKFLVRMEDVTNQVMSQITPDMTRKEKFDKIAEVSKQIEKEAKGESRYTTLVRDMFKGNQYILFVYDIFEDVRLVGAPPSNIGKFGADTDNWMWPRHTGDFSVFRVYTAPDGSPAPYSPDNIPLNPKHHLPISLNGVEKGDFSMIMGYPGRTNRYLTSNGVEEIIDYTGPFIVKVRDLKLKTMREFMDKDQAVLIKYASKYAGIANYWKYYIGQTKQLKKNKVVEKKLTVEKEFVNWVNKDPKRVEKYGNVLENISKAQAEINEMTKAITYMNEAIFGIEIFKTARGFDKLQTLLAEKEQDKEKIDATIAGIRKSLEAFFKDYDRDLDRAMFANMTEFYYKEVPEYQRSAELDIQVKKYKGDFNRMAEAMFSQSIFDEINTIETVLNKPNLKTISNDPVKLLIDNLSATTIAQHKAIAEARDAIYDNYSLYIAGLIEMHPEKQFAPDANSTMRVTYGQILDYFPADAIHYDFYTTLDGAMAKEDPTVAEFMVFDKLKELYNTKDYGQYANKNGQIVTCFLNNCDITGGNSGSPVMNGYGQLTGIAFDGNWEAMSGDIFFEPNLQRTICVDARYVLFIIDKYAGCKRLIDEMTIIKN